MKQKLQLKIQAWLDGELPDKQSRRLGDWIARDAEAGRLAADLGRVKQVMLRNEIVRTLHETREFYWSKIERQIQREAVSSHPAGPPWYARWRRLLVPAAGAALLAGGLVLQLRPARFPTFDEVTATGEGMEAVTYHDQSAQMTVVWLEDNTPAAPEKQPNQKSTAPMQDEPDAGIDLE
jgi:anti-sigma factor RsiW